MRFKAAIKPITDQWTQHPQRRVFVEIAVTSIGSGLFLTWVAATQQWNLTDKSFSSLVLAIATVTGTTLAALSALVITTVNLYHQSAIEVVSRANERASALHQHLLLNPAETTSYFSTYPEKAIDSIGLLYSANDWTEIPEYETWWEDVEGVRVGLENYDVVFRAGTQSEQNQITQTSSWAFHTGLALAFSQADGVVQRTEWVRFIRKKIDNSISNLFMIGFVTLTSIILLFGLSISTTKGFHDGWNILFGVTLLGFTSFGLGRIPWLISELRSSVTEHVDSLKIKSPSNLG